MVLSLLTDSERLYILLIQYGLARDSEYERKIRKIVSAIISLKCTRAKFKRYLHGMNLLGGCRKKQQKLYKINDICSVFPSFCTSSRFGGFSFCKFSCLPVFL